MTTERSFFHAAEGALAGLDALRDLRVLVVDDSEDMRELVATVLESSGARPRCAASCVEALAVFDRERPDIVVADIGLPDEDGYALIRRIRALAPKDGGGVPAVALTGMAEAEGPAMFAGYQRCLTKPVEPDAILTVVAELARRRLDRVAHDARRYLLAHVRAL
jgi:CheY-like chemotaxis protein